jgi:lipopolysaccharide/colanic/teichoic acid biosynthesis glycosyltransferase/ribosomal protein L33
MDLTSTLPKQHFIRTHPPKRDISVSSEIEKREVVSNTDDSVSRNPIIQEVGVEAHQFIKNKLGTIESDTFLTSTNTRFNIDRLSVGKYNNIVNLKRINDFRWINKYFESVNAKIPVGGIFIDSFESYTTRKNRILQQAIFPFNWIYYTIDVLFTRVFPKVPLTKQIYFFVTKGKGRVLSKAETFGRLYSCGFEVVDEQIIDDKMYFVARKIKEPVFDFNPTYGPLIRLKRFGQHGELFSVYKLRTMHAYSEYLQEYVFEHNQLQEGGKFKDDFRITTEGKIFRKFWFDELPMLFNVLQGKMKIVGVRPLSQQYFNLYTEELKQKRIKYKPGLIPPFYADLPKTLEEIMESELRYLEAYEKAPSRTDIQYFFKAWKNIFFKKARSN